MRYLAMILAFLAFTISPASAWYYHHHHVIKAAVSGGGSSSGAWCTGGCVGVGIGIGIGVIAGIIIVHEVLGPACAKPGLKNGYDSPTLWRPLCRYRDPSVVSVRG